MSRAGLPYSILPTQNVAAAGTGTSASTAAAAAAANSAAAAAMGTYGASSGRVSPQRTQVCVCFCIRMREHNTAPHHPPLPPLQSVDLQFSQVVSQKQNIQKDMEALQLELDSKTRENADLHSKMRSLEDDRVRLTREKQQLNLDRDEEARRLHGESERGRNQLSDMLKQLRQQVSTLESDKKSKALLHAQEMQELQEANKRLDNLVCNMICHRSFPPPPLPPHAHATHTLPTRTVRHLKEPIKHGEERHGVEARRTGKCHPLSRTPHKQLPTATAQETFVAECRKEIALKDEQVKKAKKEVARMTTTLEKVAKELVSRNKERDADILRRQQQYELDARRAGDELASLVQEKRDLTKNELQQKEELLLLKAQWDKAQTYTAELAQEIAGLNVRLEAKDEAERICMREAADAVEQLELLKSENNDLHAMNDRLNEQLAAAQEAAARAEERADRLHDDAVDTDDGMAALQRERAAYASKVVRMGEAAGAETERLVEEVDRFRLLVREAAIQHAPTEARDVEMELLREQGREAEQQQQQRKRALAPVQHGDEHAALALLQRLRDDLVMAWEDLRVVKSDVVDEIQRFNDLNAQHLALKEAYVVDREHLATLTTNLNEANAAYAKVTKERGILQDSLKEHDERMQEWVALSNDRDEHQAQLIRDNKNLKEDLDRTRQQTGASLQEKLELERLVHTVREENERLARLEYDARAQRNDYEGLVVSLREEVKVLQRSGGGGGGEEGGEGGGGEAGVLLREAETEKAVLQARVKELQARVEDAKKKVRWLFIYFC